MSKGEMHADYIVIGAGIAGTSIAYWLSKHERVIVLERETQPGYHSTGRSAALFMESYGPSQVRALTSASRSFFERPPAGFCEHELLTSRGAMHFAYCGQEIELDAHEALVRSVSRNVERLDAIEACRRVPVLRPENLLGAVYEADASDIDVHALQQGFIRGARINGNRLVSNTEVRGLKRVAGSWEIATNQGTYHAPILVNAAGAWADSIGALAGAAPIGLVPKRRSALIFPPPQGVDTSGWPMFMDIEQSFYVKPDAGMLLGSPANADPVEPHDVQPEEIDIAVAIDRIQSMTTLTVHRPSHVWAGLRSFVSDGEFVGGFDTVVPGFFWAAAQGGYGIQTAPAVGQVYAAMLRGLPVPEQIAQFGVRAEALSPVRLNSDH